MTEHNGIALPDAAAEQARCELIEERNRFIARAERYGIPTTEVTPCLRFTLVPDDAAGVIYVHDIDADVTETFKTTERGWEETVAAWIEKQKERSVL